VTKRELVLARHRRHALVAHEVALGQLLQALLSGLTVAVIESRHGAGPKDLADHGGVAQQRFAVGRQFVNAGGDQRLQ
jgi:hypothetical protein